MKKILLMALVATVMQSCNQQAEKTGYINNTKVVTDYTVMKTAQEKWTKRNEELRLELEEKAKQFQSEVQGFQNISKSMNKANQEKKQNELLAKQQQLQQEQQIRIKAIQDGSQKEIDSIITTVKDYIREYGKKNGYTYIYGDNESSNILYAKEGLEITDKVLEELNSSDK